MTRKRRADLADGDIPGNNLKDTSGDLAVDMEKKNPNIVTHINHINMTAPRSRAAEERDASAERVYRTVDVGYMTRNPELTGTLPLTPIRRLPKPAPKLLVRPHPGRSHPRPTQPYLIHRHAKRGEIDDVAPHCYCRGGTEVFVSSCGSPRWTATTDLCNMKSMHMFLCQFWSAVVTKYQNSRGIDE